MALLGLGGTIVLAGSGALDSGANKPGASVPAASPGAAQSPGTSVDPALEAPSIDGAETTLTRQATWTLTVLLPDAIPRRRDASLLVYRGDRVLVRRSVRRGERMRVAGLPLRRGENTLSVAISSPSGTSPRSGEVVITRDDVPPRLRIVSPTAGAIVNATNATVRGASEPGATVRVRNETSGDSAEALVGAGGTFEAIVDLEAGFNELVVRGEDAAGNTASERVTVTRGDGRPLAQLTLSDASFRIDRLPSTISIQVSVLDADGRPVDGAPVTFSLSPPGLPTSNYRTTTSDGAASWANVTLRREGAVPGGGFATVQVTLEGGTIVRESASFRFR